MAALPYRVVLFFGLLPALCPASTPAQSTAEDSVRIDTSRVQWERMLPRLTVTAGRVPTSPAEAPARLTVVDSTALARTGATSVAGALEARTGLHVRRYGENGLATPALRGSGASQTTLLLDGQSISNPQLGHLDLSLLPTVLLRSVEVMHGPASPLHGSDGLGGAIHLRTLRPRSSLQVRSTVHAGAFGERGGSLLAGGPLSNKASLLAAVDMQSTDGDFPYTDEARFPPQTVRRQNADRVRRSAYASLRVQHGRHHLRVSGWGTTAERGLPPLSSTATAQERQWDRHLRLWARDRVSMNPGVLTVDALTQQTRLRYANPSQDVDDTGRTWTHSLETTLRTPLTRRWSVAGGLSGHAARAAHPSLAADAHQEHLAAFAEGTGTYGRLRLYPALRADRYWMPNATSRLAVSPRLGLNLQPVAAWPSLYVKAQVGRAFRVPTFNDRYWQPGGTPDLRPERSWGGDVGVRYDRPQGHVEVTAFGHRRRDQIVWQPSGQDYWAPQNVGRVRALGAEVSAARAWPLPLSSDLHTGLTYTLTEARNRTDPSAVAYDEPLRYIPRHQAKAHSTLSWGPLSLTGHARYTGRRYVTSDGNQSLDPYVLADLQLRLAHEIAEVRTALALRVDNVLNTRYESVGGRPMPPRHARLQLHLAY